MHKEAYCAKIKKNLSLFLRKVARELQTNQFIVSYLQTVYYNYHKKTWEKIISKKF